jgi:hypothetical protein
MNGHQYRGFVSFIYRATRMVNLAILIVMSAALCAIFIDYILLHKEFVVQVLALIVVCIWLAWHSLDDLTGRMCAKYMLASYVSELSAEDRNYLVAAIISPVFQDSSSLRGRSNDRPPESPSWWSLADFMERSTVGRLARDALFQRSLLGRTRYVSDVLSISRSIGS